jgi:hypothetical protein
MINCGKRMKIKIMTQSADVLTICPARRHNRGAGGLGMDRRRRQLSRHGSEGRQASIGGGASGFGMDRALGFPANLEVDAILLANFISLGGDPTWELIPAQSEIFAQWRTCTFTNENRE